MRSLLLRNPIIRLILIAFLAVLVHGYHLGADDAEIYVPAIKRAADPLLYPFGSEFFMSHAHLSFFSDLVGGSARLAHLPVNWVIFCWHAGCVFLLLLAAWKLLCTCFVTDEARWGGVALLAGTLTVPIAGTALVIMDPYVTARTLSTPATLFTIACFLSNRPKQAAAWLLLTALVHPQMSVYAVVFLACLWLTRVIPLYAGRIPAPGLAMLAGFPFFFELSPARGAAREALFSRAYFFVSNWTWYEWFGIFAPLALACWASAKKIPGTTPVFRLILRTFVPFGLLFTCAGLLLTSSPSLENFTRLQPMRCFHLLYVIFFAMLGGLLGHYLLKTSLWRWLGLFLPLAVSMFFVQESQFPSSAHVEWPGYRYDNRWNSAFLWIRSNTPKDAVFALDPNYMLSAGEDQEGFRAVAERSALADAVKDSGAVSIFPQLADHWKSQVKAQLGWRKFKLADFEHLAALYPVTWILTQSPGPAGLVCPYQHQGLAVCRISALVASPSSPHPGMVAFR